MQSSLMSATVGWMALGTARVRKHSPGLIEFLIANALPVCFALGLSFARAPTLAIEGMACAFVIILLEYRVMLACRGPWSRALVLYLAMVLFLFTFGVIITWSETVGDSSAGTWLARMDGGLRLAIFGHVVGILGYPILLWANSLLEWPEKS